MAALLSSCVTLDEVQTPSGDLDFSAERGAAGSGGRGASGQDDEAACGAQGWAFLRLGGRDDLAAWSAPMLTLSCGAAPHRLTALAPRLGSAFALEVSASTGRALDATYSTTGIGADGEPWGDYEAWIELSALRFGAATPDQQTFQFEGSILGPFGPVPIAVSGCARVRAPGC